MVRGVHHPAIGPVTPAAPAVPGRGVVAGIVAVVCLAIMVVAARADVLDESTRQRLAALKKLCDEGLVSPEVCQEKQREILGLARGPASPPRRLTSPPRAGAPAAARPPDAAAAVPRSGDGGAEPSVHESRLGFRMRLPAGWVGMRPQELQKRVALLRTRMGDGPEAQRVPDLLGGNAEVFAKDGDQMAIIASADVVLGSAADVEELCRQISTWGAKQTGRPLQTHECGLRQIAGVSALHIDQDGLIEGRRTVQILLDAGPGRRIRFTVTCRTANVDARKAELKEVVASVTW